MTEHQTAPTELTVQQVRDHTYPLLTPIVGPEPDERGLPTYARRHGDDLAEVLVYRGEQGLRRLTDEEVTEFGAAELYSLARQRLRLIPMDGCEVVRPDRGEFHVLRGTSEFAASKLVLLPDVLRPVLGAAARARSGLLVSVPTPHELVFAPLGGDLPAILVHLARHTLMTYQDSPHPLSPTTYWWQAGNLTPVVTLDGESVDFRLPPAFIDGANSSPWGELG